MKYSIKRKTPEEQLIDFLNEAESTARIRLTGAKVSMGAKTGEDLKRAKRYAFKTAGVFIYAAYEHTEQSGVHDAYEITFSFDYLAKVKGRKRKEAVVPIFIDKDEKEENIEDIVLGALETLGNEIFSEKEGMYISGPCCMVVNEENSRKKPGVLIYYKPEEIINYQPEDF